MDEHFDSPPVEGMDEDLDLPDKRKVGTLLRMLMKHLISPCSLTLPSNFQGESRISTVTFPSATMSQTSVVFSD
ncbi:unnamed protein product [Ilex paraguariensis]|uniref:Uncharacterized protein n=1 Tax=Ilex paraguariensis TaxID=185542 RepID=A0ABC8T5A0_9AQUA